MKHARASRILREHVSDFSLDGCVRPSLDDEYIDEYIDVDEYITEYAYAYHAKDFYDDSNNNNASYIGTASDHSYWDADHLQYDRDGDRYRRMRSSRRTKRSMRKQGRQGYAA